MYLEKGEMVTLQFDNDALQLVMEGLGELPEKKSGIFKSNLHNAIMGFVNQRNMLRAAEAAETPEAKPNRAARRLAAAMAKDKPVPVEVPEATAPKAKKNNKKTGRAKK